MEEKFKNLIKQHLPELAAKELKDYLHIAEINAETVKEQKKAIEKLSEEKSKLSRDLEILKQRENSIIKLEEANKAKEIELQGKEIQLELNMMKYKNEVMGERLKDSKEFMMMLSKNPRALEYMRYSSFENIPVTDGYGGTRFETKTSIIDSVTEAIETKTDGQPVG